MTAATILKLIEGCEPDDTAKMDEIDARVWCYADCSYYGRLEPVQFIEFGKKPPRLIEDDQKEYFAEYPNHVPVGFVFKYAYMSNWWKHQGEQGPIDHKELFFTISKRYTRSRDAIKSIRPDGVFVPVQLSINGTYFVNMYGPKIISAGLKTEEFAELHATIQIIEHTRTTTPTKEE